MAKLKEFDKYHYYMRAVQSPAEDVIFLRNTFKSLTGRRPKHLTEDFCGTFAICCEWVKLGRENKAVGIDLNPEPLAYGWEHLHSKLNGAQQERIEIFNRNVLSKGFPKTDLIAAMNFSYFLFKTREQLKAYFKGCFNRLRNGGVLFADCFGGTEMGTDQEEKIRHPGFNYYWHQKNFDPIHNTAKFSIHFKRDGEKKRLNVFNYDWRIWSIPEVREIMQEVGFKKTLVYWEGTSRNGRGNGIFKPTEVGEDCAGWIAYIVGVK